MVCPARRKPVCGGPVCCVRHLLTSLPRRCKIWVTKCKTVFGDTTKSFDADMFSLIRDAINFDRASAIQVAELLNAIIMIVKNPEERTQIPNIESALYTLRKKFKSQTEDLDKCIAEEMPNFYNDAYRLETTDKENDDMPEFVRLQTEQILKDNERQGKNGCFSAHGQKSKSRNVDSPARVRQPAPKGRQTHCPQIPRG